MKAFLKPFSLLILACCLLAGSGLAFERTSRLHALNELNVEKNKAVLLRTNKCKGCYLAYTKLSGMDLAYADLRGANLIGVTFIRATLYRASLSGANISGANFSGAQWTDGSICQAGSVGRCIRKAQE
jgi:uncharacterized protein YjbI with pentapeptide repeats